MKTKWEDLVRGDVIKWVENDNPDYDSEDKITVFGTVVGVNRVTVDVNVFKEITHDEFDCYSMGEEVKIHFKGQYVNPDQVFQECLWHDDPNEKLKKLQTLYPEYFL